MINKSAAPEIKRYYDLDWLRVMAFSILLFEHSAEIFVNWKFWIKNDITSPLLTYFIAFFLPWRMPLLFLISGAVVTLTFKRRTFFSFIQERAARLLLPLLFAVMFIIPPQLYFIRKFAGYDESFLHFYTSILQLDLHWGTRGNIHFLHLWYLAFLFAYCIIVLPLFYFMRSETGSRIVLKLNDLVSKPLVLFSLGTLITLPFYFLPIYHGGTYKASFVYYFPFFVCGVLFWSNSLIRTVLKEYAGSTLVLAIAVTANLYSLAIVSKDPHFYFLNVVESSDLVVYVLKSFNQWFWILTIFGWAMRLVKSGSPVLNYANQAVYPFYILHQTVIVIFGYYLISYPAGIAFKLGAVILLSFTFIFLFYQFIIKRAGSLMLFFGIKPGKKKVRAMHPVEFPAVAVEG